MSGEPTNNFEDYELRLTMEKSIGEYAEFPYISTVSGQIYYYTKESDRGSVCGRFKAYFVNREQAINDGASIWIELDDHSNELSRYASLFKDDSFLGEVPSMAVTKALTDDEENPYEDFMLNLVILSRLEIVSSHRGKGLGTHILRRAMNYFEQIFSFGFFAIQPFPRQLEPKGDRVVPWERRMRLDKLEQNPKAAREKLYHLYKKLGFRRVRGTDLMVRRAYD